MKDKTIKLESAVYSKEGKEVSTIALPESVFGAAWNADLVHQVVVSMQGNARAGTANAKGRGDVAGGGKKPWKQKGTGRARHGSSRSPIWVGGGQAHGPKSIKDYSRKVNKNAKAKALACVLSQKLRDNEILFVDSFGFNEPKAKDAKGILGALSTASGMERLKTKRVNTALILIPERDTATELSFRNFGNIEVMQTKDVNPVELLTYKYVVVAKPEENVEALTRRVATKSVRKTTSAAKATK
jgi:large subunit ribosomal protein L4